MDALISQTATLMGVDATTAQMVLGGMLELARTNLGDAAPGLMSQIPGADALLASVGGASDGGGLGGAASSLLGGGSGGASDLGALAGAALGGGDGGGLGPLVGLMGQSGVDGGQLAGAASLLGDYVRENAGADAASQMMGAIPGLDALERLR